MEVDVKQSKAPMARKGLSLLFSLFVQNYIFSFFCLYRFCSDYSRGYMSVV